MKSWPLGSNALGKIVAATWSQALIGGIVTLVWRSVMQGLDRCFAVLWNFGVGHVLFLTTELPWRCKEMNLIFLVTKVRQQQWSIMWWLLSEMPLPAMESFKSLMKLMESFKSLMKFLLVPPDFEVDEFIATSHGDKSGGKEGAIKKASQTKGSKKGGKKGGCQDQLSLWWLSIHKNEALCKIAALTPCESCVFNLEFLWWLTVTIEKSGHWRIVGCEINLAVNWTNCVSMT